MPTCSLPTTAILFSDWQAMMQLLQPDALVQIDRHAPGVGLGLVRIIGIKRQIVGRLFVLGEVGLFRVLVDRRHPHQWTCSHGGVHGLLALRAGQHVSAARGANLDSVGEPQRRALAEGIEIESRAGAGASRARASGTEIDRDRVVGKPGLNPNRRLYLLSVELELDYVFRGEVQTLRHRRADQHRVVPGHLAHGARQFLQPPVVGETAVVERRIAAEVEFDAARTLGRHWRKVCRA